MKRFLALLLIAIIPISILPQMAFAAIAATPTTAKVMIDGKSVAFDAYEIGGNNYFKLRDLALALSRSRKEFEVTWDGAKDAIDLIPGRAYTTVGGELAGGLPGTRNAEPTTSATYVDGVRTSFIAYNIGGNNYFKLRDIARVLGFGVEWDGAAQTIAIDTAREYSEPLSPLYTDSAARALAYLKSRQDAGIDSLYVYRDFATADNRFTVKAKVSDSGHPSLVYDMNENCQLDPYSGDSCIECRVDTAWTSWGGWLFTNGCLPPGETVPELNFGERDDCGYDLTGAESLTFVAKGQVGGEKVEFFTAGLGYDGATGRQLEDYPDSNRKVSTGFIQLSDDWQEYTIDLSGADLSYISCGFGFVCSGTVKQGNTVFYLDEIRFNGLDDAQAPSPRFIQSYETNTMDNPDDIYLQNAAFSYDNAVAAMAFMSAGEKEEAGLILDAFVRAIEHDRYRPDRVRNSYPFGVPDAFPGWGGKTRLSGYYSQADRKYYEDQYQVGTNVGNSSFVALALMQYHSRYNEPAYLQYAKVAMDWVLAECSDPSGAGFFAGYDGWPENGATTRFTYKSIEHNIDAYAAFRGLYELTGDSKYQTGAKSALEFVGSMYDSAKGLFYTGTTGDGRTPSKDNIVLDAQVWSALALGEAFEPYRPAFSYALENLRTAGGGYAFHQDANNDGYWLEGTAFTSLAMRQMGMEQDALGAFDAIVAKQLPSGGLPAATVEALDTGFTLFTGDPWRYGDRPHIAPVAWYVMAVNNFNPYEF